MVRLERDLVAKGLEVMAGNAKKNPQPANQVRL